MNHGHFGRPRIPAAEVARIRGDMRRMIREQLGKLAGPELESFESSLSQAAADAQVPLLDINGRLREENVPARLSEASIESAIDSKIDSLEVTPEKTTFFDGEGRLREENVPARLTEDALESTFAALEGDRLSIDGDPLGPATVGAQPAGDYMPDHPTGAAGLAVLAAPTPADGRTALGAQPAGEYLTVGGRALGGDDLNTVTTHGVYRQSTGASATLERNYPREGATGVLEVLPIFGTNFVMQRYTDYGDSGRAMYVRRLGGSGWEPWRQYLPTAVDTSVGTRVMVGGVMVYGDTGWRNVTTWDVEGNVSGELPSGLEPIPGLAGGISVRRINDRVTYALRSARATENVQQLSLPPGFRPGGVPYPVGSVTVSDKGTYFWQAGATQLWLYIPNGVATGASSTSSSYASTITIDSQTAFPEPPYVGTPA